MPQKKAKAMPMNSRKLISGLPEKSEKPMDMPTQAPRTVGTMVAASIQ
jgi:hypothetical protein